MICIIINTLIILLIIPCHLSDILHLQSLIPFWTSVDFLLTVYKPKFKCPYLIPLVGVSDSVGCGLVQLMVWRRASTEAFGAVLVTR